MALLFIDATFLFSLSLSILLERNRLGKKGGTIWGIQFPRVVFQGWKKFCEKLSFFFAFSSIFEIMEISIFDTRIRMRNGRIDIRLHFPRLSPPSCNCWMPPVSTKSKVIPCLLINFYQLHRFRSLSNFELKFFPKTVTARSRRESIPK